MKRFILSISLLCIFSLYIYPQCIPAYSRGSNVYTCNNVAVETYAPSCEWSAAQKATIKSDLLAEYASAGITSDDILADASTAYNCHAYAWHLTEGQSNYVWINQYTSNGDYNIANYWLGGLNACFDQSSETTSYDKIFYYSGDHSAVKSSVSGKYESKWGNSCLVRHAPTAVPNTYNSSYRRYYVHNPHIYISGPKYFNTSGTFTINNLPSGASVTINCYYPLQTSRSGNVITVTNPYGEAGFASL
jgi:hypothetical protein